MWYLVKEDTGEIIQRQSNNLYNIGQRVVPANPPYVTGLTHRFEGDTIVEIDVDQVPALTEQETLEFLRSSAVVERVDLASRMITDNPDDRAELEAWVLDNVIPPRASGVFDALPTLADKLAAKTSATLHRSSPLIAPFAALYGYDTPEKVDHLFEINI